MFKIALNKIYLTRGDTARFSISLGGDKCATAYTLSEQDQVYFIVTRDIKIIPIEGIENNTDCLFYKSGVNIVIDPEDTENLEEGSYYYQVRAILQESGDLNTIIEPEEFIITPKKVF